MLRLQQQLEYLSFRTKRQRLTRRQLALKRLSLPRCNTTPNGSMNGVCVSKVVLAQAGTILTSRSLRVRSASALPEAPSLQDRPCVTNASEPFGEKRSLSPSTHFREKGIPTRATEQRPCLLRVAKEQQGERENSIYIIMKGANGVRTLCETTREKFVLVRSNINL